MANQKLIQPKQIDTTKLAEVLKPGILTNVQSSDLTFTGEVNVPDGTKDTAVANIKYVKDKIKTEINAIKGAVDELANFQDLDTLSEIASNLSTVKANITTINGKIESLENKPDSSKTYDLLSTSSASTNGKVSISLSENGVADKDPIKLSGNNGIEVTSDAGGDILFTGINAATDKAGMMSAADKTKLEGIATGATKVTIIDVNINPSTIGNKDVSSGLTLTDTSSITFIPNDPGYWTDANVIISRSGNNVRFAVGTALSGVTSITGTLIIK